MGHKLGEVDSRFPWAGVVRVLAEGNLSDMVFALRRHPRAEYLRVWMPVSRHWAMPYEAELLNTADQNARFDERLLGANGPDAALPAGY